MFIVILPGKSAAAKSALEDPTGVNILVHPQKSLLTPSRQVLYNEHKQPSYQNAGISMSLVHHVVGATSR